MSDVDELRGEAHARFGVRSFRPGQRRILEAVLAGRDVLGLLPTGGGKSLTYQLPSLALEGLVVVVSPLLALIRDQQDKADEAELDAVRLDSTVSPRAAREVEAEVDRGEASLLYVTPERLAKPEVVDLLRGRGVARLVIDEAHCISQWGHDFRPAYLQLGAARAALGDPPVLALTATATAAVMRDIGEQLRLRDPVVVDTGVVRDNLAFEVHRTPDADAKRARLRELLHRVDGPAIVYAATVKTVDALHTWLSEQQLPVARYHGQLGARERDEQQTRFMSGEARIMVATKAFGLGVDKADVRLVVHHEFPDSLETYTQEAGRAGRDGKPATAALLFRVEDKRIQRWFLGGKYPARAEIGRLLDALPASPRPLPALAEQARLSSRRAQVVAALLEGAGLLERTRRGVRRTAAAPSADERERLLSTYERRYAADEARLRAMMHYAQASLCRAQLIAGYFDEETARCGRCDVCRRGAAPGLPLEDGARVRHRSFGAGTVRAVKAERVAVEFADGTTRFVRAPSLERLH